MVSSCELYFDEIVLNGQKAFVPDYLSSLFQESDRVEYHDKKEKVDIVQYEATRKTILMRLNLMGCTEELSKQRFQEWLAENIEDEIEYQKETLEEYPQRKLDSSDNTLTALQGFSLKEWRKRVPKVLHTMYDEHLYDKYLDETDRQMKDADPSWLWFDGHDSLLSFRAIIDACPEAEMVKLDVGSLIHGGWIGLDEKVCDNKIRVVPSRGQASGPVIILAEGRSDIAVLKASIVRFHPELTGFITFLDHGDFQVDGGASFVVKFLKAFAAARVPSNIVAVFDNDTAGLVAFRQAEQLNFPSNMTCVHLPDVEIARSYPTIGPQGNHDTNINGKACGIELYLGKNALSLEGQLRPVRWTGYDKSTKNYQGEVDEKEEVQKSFLETMNNKSQEFDISEYSEMQLLWKTILKAASDIAEASQKSSRIPHRW